MGKAKSFIEEFKEFINRGNVLDMAIGVVIATAFGKITTSLVNEVIMPLIGWICGDIDLTKLNITLSPAVTNEAGEVVKEAVVIAIGSFLATIVDFLIVAFIVFLVVKAINKAKELEENAKKKEEEAPVEEAPAEPSEEVKLLMEIRDSLKK